MPHGGPAYYVTYATLDARKICTPSLETTLAIGQQPSTQIHT